MGRSLGVAAFRALLHTLEKKCQKVDFLLKNGRKGRERAKVFFDDFLTTFSARQLRGLKSDRKGPLPSTCRFF
jgi:hypothetical protein